MGLIKAVCTESGLLAIRERRMRDEGGLHDIERARAIQEEKEGTPEGLYLGLGLYV